MKSPVCKAHRPQKASKTFSHALWLPNGEVVKALEVRVNILRSQSHLIKPEALLKQSTYGEIHKSLLLSFE